MKKSHEAHSPKPKERQYSKIQLYQQTKCKQLATKLLLSYKHLVGSTARKLSRDRPDLYDDLFQVGQISLLRSLERYDQKQGSPFEAYARKSIKGSMMNYLRDKAWIKPMPRWMKENWVTVQQAIDELTVKKERSPSISEIADYSNLSMDVTEKVLAGQANAHVASLDAPLNNEHEVITLSEMIGAEAREYQAVETFMDLSLAWSQLSKKEQQILHLSLIEMESQRTIANQLGVSQMTVSRILKQALVKLKQGLAYPISTINA
ncbi:RNA polymerase sigma-B factor [Neobacillus rhizosphaerae]|uniref:RNA polymerase sigma-B factor n=1 Tax=Neobacillus rhizosphaerae TaxID=2880965 RepID=A0ABN8KPD0_9BACI|nr:sigma-70 family RNA polymerase sigma factor [Neobacillus rhizosphaerae]CAH2714079.1 RNA polymerase sigma-B factor [Neobacillus rhizosphaerae]